MLKMITDLNLIFNVMKICIKTHQFNAQKYVTNVRAPLPFRAESVIFIIDIGHPDSEKVSEINRIEGGVWYLHILQMMSLVAFFVMY